MARLADRPMKRALVVGGVASFIQETGRKKLARWGITPDWHVPMGTRQEMNPGTDSRCELVIVFSDMVSHRRVTAAWQEHCMARSIPCVSVDRHESHWERPMAQAGIKTINPVTASAVAELEEHEMAPNEKDQKRLAAVVAPINPPTTGSSFHGRKAALLELLREMKEKDGLHELMWGADSGVTWRRAIVEEGSEGP